MGDPIENDIFSTKFQPYGKPIHVQLEKARGTLIGAEVFRVAYEEAIRKWRRKVGEIYAILGDTRTEVNMDWRKITAAETELQKLAAEMDQTVK